MHIDSHLECTRHGNGGLYRASGERVRALQDFSRAGAVLAVLPEAALERFPGLPAGSDRPSSCTHQRESITGTTTAAQATASPSMIQERERRPWGSIPSFIAFALDGLAIISPRHLWSLAEFPSAS